MPTALDILPERCWIIHKLFIADIANNCWRHAGVMSIFNMRRRRKSELRIECADSRAVSRAGRRLMADQVLGLERPRHVTCWATCLRVNYNTDAVNRLRLGGATCLRGNDRERAGSQEPARRGDVLARELQYGCRQPLAAGRSDALARERPRTGWQPRTCSAGRRAARELQSEYENQRSRSLRTPNPVPLWHPL